MALDYFATQAGSYSAETTRRAMFAPYARTSANSPGIIAGGLLSSADLQITAPVSGMTVNIGTGEGIIGGSEGGAQGGYYFRNSSSFSAPVAAANPSNPRVDAVCATMADAGYTQPSDVGSTTNGPVLAVVTGTPTAGANVTPGSGGYLAGAPSIPLSTLLLGYVLVPTSATNIVTADILNVAGPLSMTASVAGVGGATVRGAVNIPASQSTSSGSFTTLATPDQISGLVLPTNGLIRVWYQAIWQESVAHEAHAAIFLNSNQLMVAASAPGGASTQEAQTITGSFTGVNCSLFSTPVGLATQAPKSVSYGGDVTTGQVVGFAEQACDPQMAIAGSGWDIPAVPMGGPCDIFAAAGTYTVSVQFLAVSGSVTVSNRKLWVQVLPFS